MKPTQHFVVKFEFVRTSILKVLGACLFLVRLMQRGLIIAAFCGAAFLAIADGINTDYITPPFTFSPDHRYGVMSPVFHDVAVREPDHRMNKVIELRTSHIVAVIRGEPGYNRALNFHETAAPR